MKAVFHYFSFYICMVLLVPSSFGSPRLKAGFTSFENFGVELPASLSIKVWKNETLPLVLQIESEKDEPIEIEIKIGNKRIKKSIYQLAYVEGDFSAGNCGGNKKNGIFEKGRFPDRSVRILDGKIHPDSTTHYVLIHLEIEKNTKKGKYPIRIQLIQNGQTTNAKAAIEVIDRKLPPFEDMKFGVDFWQYPLSVAHYYDVIPYGQKHLEHLDLMFKQLHYINQKVITTSVFWDTYNSSIRPREHMMIQVCKGKDGSYTYDYSNFEKYVSLGIANGIDHQISVHNIFPWNNYFFYQDEEKGEVVGIRSLPLTPEYKKFWGNLIMNFSAFLAQKGWLEKTVIYIDERNIPQTLSVAKFIKEINPQLKVGYAGKYSEALSPYIAEYSLPSNVVLEKGIIETRKKNGQSTSLYTSCFEKQPNMLMMSNYGDIYFLSMLSKANGYDGILRWAFNLWSSQIKASAIATDMPSGDAHFVYPDGQVSLRYWVIRDALEEIMKVEDQTGKEKTKEMLIAHQRYYLLNNESERMNMVSTMKQFLNE